MHCASIPLLIMRFWETETQGVNERHSVQTKTYIQTKTHSDADHKFHMIYLGKVTHSFRNIVQMKLLTHALNSIIDICLRKNHNIMQYDIVARR